MNARSIFQWIIDRIPARLLAEPERFMLALCFAVIGADAVFLGAPRSVFGGIPDAHLFNLEFGSCLLAGGICKILGLWRRRIWLQRLGAAFLILGCFGVILGIWLYVGKDGIPVAIVYGLFGLTYVLRLLSSTAARFKLHRGVEEL